MSGETTRMTLESAYGDYLGRSFVWTHFGTLTFRYSTSDLAAMSRFEAWIERIEVTYRGTLGWFASVECDKQGSAHIHFLLKANFPVTSRRLSEHWGSGYARISRYDPERRGSYYVTKGVGRKLAVYGFSLPRT